MTTLQTDAVAEQLHDLGLTFPRVIGNTDEMSQELWRDERRRGLGGSDAAAAAGLSRWKSRYVLFMDKRAEIPVVEETRRMTLGKVFEDPIARLYAMDNEADVVQIPALLQHPEIPWMLANVDRFVLDPETRQIGGALECKMTDERMSRYWDDGEAPIEHQCQCIHYMAVTGLPWVDLTALIGRDTTTLRIHRDEEAIANLIDVEDRFWKLVEANTPPSVDGEAAKSTLELLGQLFSDPSPDSRINMEEATSTGELTRDLIGHRLAIVAQRKSLKDELDRVDAQLCEMLGAAELGYLDGQLAFTWKRTDKKGYYVNPTNFRTPRIPAGFAKTF